MAGKDAQRDDERDGQHVLARLSNEMVRAQKEFFGKGPTSARSYIIDDLLIIVMRGGLTTAERTMLEFGHADQVRQFRQIFENEMGDRLIGMVEDVTGRRVANYQSQIMFDPDVVIEMFIFDEPGDGDARRATAEGQLAEGDTGAATDADALDSRAESAGQG